MYLCKSMLYAFIDLNLRELCSGKVSPLNCRFGWTFAYCKTEHTWLFLELAWDVITHFRGRRRIGLIQTFAHEWHLATYTRNHTRPSYQVWPLFPLSPHRTVVRLPQHCQTISVIWPPDFAFISLASISNPLSRNLEINIEFKLHYVTLLKRVFVR